MLGFRTYCFTTFPWILGLDSIKLSLKLKHLLLLLNESLDQTMKSLGRTSELEGGAEKPAHTSFPPLALFLLFEAGNPGSDFRVVISATRSLSSTRSNDRYRSNVSTI
jgi:hypothetical protein